MADDPATVLQQQQQQLQQMQQMMQQQNVEMQNLRQQLQQQQQELQAASTAATNAVQNAQAANAAAATAAAATAQATAQQVPPPANAETSTAKLLKQPAALGKDNWSEFRFASENYMSSISHHYLNEMNLAAESNDKIDESDMTNEVLQRSINLFSLLAQWTSSHRESRVLARGLNKQKNGYELWRLLVQRMEPEILSKGLVWRRALLSPEFPNKETEFQTALEDWEGELRKYEEQEGKTIEDEDKLGVLLEVAPPSLKQHLQQNLSSLNTFSLMRAQILSYLGSKKTYVMEGRQGKAFGAANQPKKTDPNAMQIDAFGRDPKGKGKGGGKDPKGKAKGRGGKSKDKGAQAAPKAKAKAKAKAQAQKESAAK